MGILFLTLALFIPSSAAPVPFPCPSGDKGSTAVIPGTVCEPAPLLTQQIHPRYHARDAAAPRVSTPLLWMGQCVLWSQAGLLQFATRKSTRVIATLKHTKQDFPNVPLQPQTRCQNRLYKSVSFQAQCRKPRTHLALYLTKSFWQVQELHRKKIKVLSTSLVHFFCHKQIAGFICKAGQTSSSQNIGKSHVSHDWKTFPTAALPSQSQPHPYHTQKHVQNHAKAWICALQHDSSSASPTEAPQRT